MPAFSLATELEEMESSPSNLIIRLQGPSVTEDKANGKLQLELLDRVEHILGKYAFPLT
jgi:hypothetical protein